MPDNNMATIKLAATHGVLTVVSNYKPASQTINGVNIEICFRTEDWNPLTHQIYFYKGLQSYEQTLDATNIITVPAEVLNCTTDSEFSINLDGIGNGTVLTTNRITIHVNIGLRDGVLSLLSVTPVQGTYNIPDDEDECGTIKMAVNHGNLRVIKDYTPASQTVNSCRIEFTFETSEWDSLTKTVAFYRDEQSYGVTLIPNQNCCVIPWEILNVNCISDCSYSVNIIGTDDGIVLPTQRVKMKINLGGCNSLVYGCEPTHSLYEQLINLINTKQNNLTPGDNISIINNVISANAVDKHYLHRQRVASNVWAIQHNLSKFPSVSITDSANGVVTGDVEYVDENNLILRFSAPFSGVCYCN